MNLPSTSDIKEILGPSVNARGCLDVRHKRTR
jgi:hypothetical protein